MGSSNTGTIVTVIVVVVVVAVIALICTSYSDLHFYEVYIYLYNILHLQAHNMLLVEYYAVYYIIYNTLCMMHY